MDALEDLQTESINREKELEEAQAALEEKGRVSSSDIGWMLSLEPARSESITAFDPAEYSQDKYALANFPGLKSVTFAQRKNDIPSSGY